MKRRDWLKALFALPAILFGRSLAADENETDVLVDVIKLKDGWHEIRAKKDATALGGFRVSICPSIVADEFDRNV